MGRILRIVVDHLSGSRRGQRDELEPLERIRFGRHPEGDVVFDAKRDLDVSTRHAELRRDEDGGGYTLRDVGSSNGTYVDGRRITSRGLGPGASLVVEFGEGGPMLRLFACDDEHPEPPALSEPASRSRTPMWLVAVALVVAAVAVSGLFWLR